MCSCLSSSEFNQEHKYEGGNRGFIFIVISFGFKNTTAKSRFEDRIFVCSSAHVYLHPCLFSAYLKEEIDFRSTNLNEVIVGLSMFIISINEPTTPSNNMTTIGNHHHYCHQELSHLHLYLHLPSFEHPFYCCRFEIRGKGPRGPA